MNKVVNSGPVSLALGDLNSDGNWDLAVADSSAGVISVLLGNGDGTFQAAVDYTAGANVFSVAIADMNNDGIPDLVAVVNEESEVVVLFGINGGTFGGPKPHSVGVSPIGLVVADFNGDGNQDVAVTGFTGTVTILQGNGNGSFQAPTYFVAGSGSYGIIQLKIGSSALPDLVVANQFADTVAILTNTTP